MELVDDVPTRKSQYNWNDYFKQLLANPTKALKFSGVARTTVKDAVERFNADENNTVELFIRGQRVKTGKGKDAKTTEYIYVSIVPSETEQEEPA